MGLRPHRMGVMTDHPVKVRLCAELSAEWKDRVEELLFFNPLQALLEEQILKTINAFGLPRVVPQGSNLRVEVGDSTPVGTLFALVDREGADHLAGLLLFSRNQSELLCLHLTVDENYAARGDYGSLQIATRLLEELRRIGTRIAGVEHIALYYQHGGWYNLPISVKLL